MIAEGDGPNARYRIFGPADELRRRGHRVLASVWDEMKDPNALLDYDVVVGWRLHDEFFTRVARLLADARIGFVWDNDDNLAAIDVKGRPNHRYFSGLSGQRIFAEQCALMRLANIVTTPSAGLAQHYRETTGADVRVVENFVRLVAPRSAPREPQQLAVGWVAHVEHQTDIERLRLQDALGRLLERHPHVHMLTVGCGLGLPSPRYQHIKRLEFERLPNYVTAFDVGIAPIADSEFNRSRSNVKVKEYAALGVPWLASPIGPYADLGEDEGGRLVPDDRWLEEIERLVLDHKARRKLAKRAVKWGQRQTIAANVHVWEETLREAAERAGRRV